MGVPLHLRFFFFAFELARLFIIFWAYYHGFWTEAYNDHGYKPIDESPKPWCRKVGVRAVVNSIVVGLLALIAIGFVVDRALKWRAEQQEIKERHRAHSH